MEKKLNYMFFIHIKRNCNEWVGEVEWLSDGMEEPFDSVLELLQIIERRIHLKDEWREKKCLHFHE